MNSPQVSLEPIKRSTLTVAEAAEYIGISKDTAYMLCRERRLPHVRVGSRILLKKNKIDEWMEKQMQETMQDEY